MPGTAFDCVFPGSAEKVDRGALFLPPAFQCAALTQMLGDCTPCIGVIIPHNSQAGVVSFNQVPHGSMTFPIVIISQVGYHKRDTK